jgi:hypothetical protein
MAASIDRQCLGTDTTNFLEIDTMDLENIRQRCHIDEDTGCWIWAGALSEGKWPRIHSPNHSKPGSPMETQTGRRAVWQLSTGKAIPKGHRVYGTCRCNTCLNPSHMKCGPAADWGKYKAQIGLHKTVRHVIGARKNGRANSVLTEATYAEILSSNEIGLHIAKRLGIGRAVVSRVRTGKLVSFKPVGGPFSGLVR